MTKAEKAWDDFSTTVAIVERRIEFEDARGNHDLARRMLEALCRVVESTAVALERILT